VPDDVPPVDLASVPALLRGQVFEDVTVGDRFRTASRTITETDLVTWPG
jgi:hypothetical protein